MNREEFKQRMKSLKSYREQNPDKGYWDWKVEQFQDGGEKDNTPRMKELVQYQDNARVGAATQVPEIPTNIVRRNGPLSAGLLDYAPVVGDTVEVANIVHDVKEGNYKDAAIGLGLLAIPGAVASKAYRLLKAKLNPRIKHLLDIRKQYNQYTPKIATIENIQQYNPDILNDEEILRQLKEADYDVSKGRISLQNKQLHPIFELATHTRRFKKAYPHGYQITYRGIDPNPDNTNKLYTGYENAVFTIKDSDKKIHSYYGTSKNTKYGDGKFDVPYIKRLSDKPNGGIYQLIYPKQVPITQIDAKNHYFTDLDFLNMKFRDTDEFAYGVSSGELPSIIFKNIYDPRLIKEELIYQNIPGQYLKSALGSNLKFNLNSPELFETGGEVPPTNYQGSNEPVNVNPFTKKPLANGSITPILDLEDASGFTPIGDILSIRDAYIAAQNKDLLGLGLAGLGILPLVPRLGRARAAKRTLDSPTIPTVDKDYFQRQFEEMEKRDAKRHQVADDFYRQRNEVLESLIENEDVFRRSANSDRLYGTNYKRVYEEAIKTYDKDKSPYNDDLPQMAFDHRLYKTDIKGQVDPKQLHRITINPRYSDLDELDDGFQRINEGLVRHEMGHITDEKAGKGLVDRLADPTKFVDEAQLQEMYPRTYRSFSKNILRRGSEIKSYMNEFRDFLAHQGIYSSKETVNSFRKKLDQYGDQFKVLRRIFDSYKNKRDFIKDYNTIPILGTGAIGINYYFNQQEE